MRVKKGKGLPRATREYPEKWLQFLDKLRESGQTNMFEAAPYLRKEFHLTEKRAKRVVLHWMIHFDERQRARQDASKDTR